MHKIQNELDIVKKNNSICMYILEKNNICYYYLQSKLPVNELYKIVKIKQKLLNNNFNILKYHQIATKYSAKLKYGNSNKRHI